MDLSSLRKKTKPLSIDFGDGMVLNVQYKPNGLALKDLEGQGIDTVKEQVLLLVESWDLEDDGSAVELTSEGLSGIPLNVLKTVLESVLGDMMPNPSTGLT